MMSLFRRMLHSKVGVVVTFIVLIIIAILFGLGGTTTNFGGGSAPTGDQVATVGKVVITPTALSDQIRTTFGGIQRQNPGVTMEQFLAQQGFEGTLDRMLTSAALKQFGQQQGMLVSKRLIDGQIASAPAFQDAGQKFSQALYDQFLVRQRTTDANIRSSIGEDLYAQQIMFPVDQRGMFPGSTASITPRNLALVYASLLLEKRDGQIGFVPSAAMAQGAPPTDAELAQYYKQHTDRYTVGERRIIRYAVVSPAMVKAQATPTDAEITARYQRDHAQYVAVEKRSVTQVVLLDQKAAAVLAAKAKAGGSIEDAAKASGLEAARIAGVAKPDYARQTSPEIADAVFAATKGAVLGPVKSPLGWVVIRLDGINQIAAKSLDQAKPDIVKALTAEKTTAAMAKIRDAIDDATTNEATFDEIVADQKLTAQTTPALLATGVDPDNPAAKPDPALAQVVAAGFQAEQGDAPQLVQFGTDGFAIAGLSKIVPAAPRPLAAIRDAVVRDFSVDRAKRAAHDLADKIASAVQGGKSLTAALQAAKPGLPPVKPMTAIRQQVEQGNLGLAKAPLSLLFSMKQKTVRLLEAPQNAGWYVIYLDHIQPGDASGNAQLLTGQRGALDQALGAEYLEQFAKAVRNSVGTTRNEAAIKKVRDQLGGQQGDSD